MMFGIPYTNMYKIATHLERKFSAIKNRKKSTARAVILSLIFARRRANFLLCQTLIKASCLTHSAKQSKIAMLATKLYHRKQKKQVNTCFASVVERII